MKKIIAALAIVLTSGTSIGQNLLLHYDFNETLEDKSGNSLDGFMNLGSPEYVLNEENKMGAIKLTVDTQFVQIPRSNIIMPLLFPVTVTSKFLIDTLDASPSHCFFASSIGIDKYYGVYCQVLPNGSVAITIGDGGVAGKYTRRSFHTPNNVIEEGKWYNVRCTFRGPDDMEIWIDCDQYKGGPDYDCGTASNITSSYYTGCGNITNMVYGTTSEPAGVGKIDAYGTNYTYNNTYFFSGYIDDIKFYGSDMEDCEYVLNSQAIESNESDIAFYPNPADNSIVLTSQKEFSFVIYDQQGHIIESRSNSNHYAINSSHIASGLYIIKAIASEGHTEILKAIIKH